MGEHLFQLPVVGFKGKLFPTFFCEDIKFQLPVVGFKEKTGDALEFICESFSFQ